MAFNKKNGLIVMTSFILTFLTMTTLAGPKNQTIPVDVPGAHDGQANVEAFPLAGVVAMERKGVVRFMSQNSRFLFKGEVIDQWSGKNIKSLSDVAHAFNYLNFQNIQFSPEALNPFKIGNGEKVITMFIDPLCPHCHRIFKELPTTSSEYTFLVIPVGLLGKASIESVKLLECAADQEVALQALLSQKYDGLEQKKGECKMDNVAKRLLSAQLIGIAGVPFIIRHDGLVARGFPPKGFMKWLEG